MLDTGKIHNYQDNPNLIFNLNDVVVSQTIKNRDVAMEQVKAVQDAAAKDAKMFEFLLSKQLKEASKHKDNVGSNLHYQKQVIDKLDPIIMEITQLSRSGRHEVIDAQFKTLHESMDKIVSTRYH